MQKNTGVIILIVVISAAFILQFGPQASGCGQDLKFSGVDHAAKVYGTTVGIGDFDAAFTLMGWNQLPPERQQSMEVREHTLNGLVQTITPTSDRH